MARTSEDFPLRIDTVTLPNGAQLGLSLCPGKKQTSSLSGGWDRDLALDVGAIRDWGAQTVVSILEPQELKDLQVEGLGAAVHDAGMAWLHLDQWPNDTVPGKALLQSWRRQHDGIHDILRSGGKVFVHCMGGIGRTSTLAAMILVEEGMPLEQAMAAIKAARSSSFVVPGQVEFLQDFRPTRQGKAR